MRWFRLYSSMIDDEKVQRLTDAQFKFWINVLCVATEEGKEGRLPPATEIAYRVRTRLDHCVSMLHKLHERGLLDLCSDCVTSPSNPRRPDVTVSLGERYAVHNWSTRQYKSDDVTARVKRFRNVTETPPDTDTETDTEADRRKQRRSINPPARTRAGKGGKADGEESPFAKYGRSADDDAGTP